MGKKSKSRTWHLNPEEVSCGWVSSSIGKKGVFTRKLKTISKHLFLTHDPTGIKVEGEIPTGNYSKKEMKEKTKEAERKLFRELELKVAKKLRIRGR
jgi:hypothetical protein